MSDKQTYKFGSHKLHCRSEETRLRIHVTGETQAIVDRRWKVAEKLKRRYLKTGKVPKSTPQGIVFEVVKKKKANHGDGGP